MGKLDGKVAFITGAARGQGRSHAVRLAAEGADIIAVDLGAGIGSVPYPLAKRQDLDETAAEVEGLGRRIVAREADVRDRTALRAAVDDGVGVLGRIDIVLANAGIAPLRLEDDDARAFDDAVAVNLTGAWNTVEAARSLLIEQGQGGAIVLTSSTAGVKGVGFDSPGAAGYTASKHGVVGLMRYYAPLLARYSIRVNSVHPTGVNTPMVTNENLEKLLAAGRFIGDLTNALPVELTEPVDISNAVLYLVSDDGRYVTGVMLPVDAGFLVK